MSDYPLTWITKNIAAGRAPMSYEDLDSLRERGVNAIVNLCGEFSDLHELEEQAGFEVFWIPIADETAPSMSEMEKGLEWLDEAVYLGKKVLVHCRHGIGRTGTFITAYLLRRGFGLKKAGKMLKKTSANPTNFSQWWLLRKFNKQEGQLKHGEPTPENRTSKDLDQYYKRYEQLLKKVDSFIGAISPGNGATFCCSTKERNSCQGSFSLELIEALYLNNKVNVTLTSRQRQTAIARATVAQHSPAQKGEEQDSTAIKPTINGSGNSCPLREGDACLLHQFRPVQCRLQHYRGDSPVAEEIGRELTQLSREVFEKLFGQKTASAPPSVSYHDSVSGKFIQSYFQFLVTQKNNVQ